MKISVITPFYEGNEYMPRYFEMMEKNRKNLKQHKEANEVSLEVILVNDSPMVQMEVPKNVKSQEWLILVEQEKNQGIHGARVNGLSHATGDYVMFLDQDDVLADDAIWQFVKAMILDVPKGEMPKANGQETCVFKGSLEKKVYVCNAVLEQEYSNALWYRSEYHKQKIGDYKTYLRVGTQIISPGQCLVAKDVIPNSWLTRRCTKNGADDYYLWILLLAQNIPFTYVDKPLYIHKYTAKNLSADTTVTDESSYEFIGFMREDGSISNKDANLLERMLRYKAAFRKGNKLEKIWYSLINLDLFICNVVYKLKTKTKYGFNR